MRLGWLLGLCLLAGLLAAALPQWGVRPLLIGDGPYYRAALQALLENRDLHVHRHLPPEAGREDRVSIGARGEIYPKHALLMPVLSMPFYALAGEAGLLAFNLLQLWLLGLLIWRCARRHTTDLAAAGVALAFSFGTLLRPAAFNWSPDVLAGLLVLAAVLAALEESPLLSGALLGLSAWAKLTDVILVPVVLGWAAFALPPRQRLRLAAAALVPLAALAALHWWMFGSPLVTPYDRVLASRGSAGLVVQLTHRALFDKPIAGGLLEQLVQPRIGLLASAPFLTLALPGLFALWNRARREAVLVGALVAVQIAFFAPYRRWAESSFGHRFLLPAIVLCVFPVAALVDLWLPKNKEVGSAEPLPAGM